MFLIVDASYRSEVSIYYVNGLDAPSHMKDQLESSGRRAFKDILEYGPETLDGLVDEESDEADARAEEVWGWIYDSIIPQNVFNPTDDSVVITHTISMAPV